jgi:tetratricopeptide (TPR) repeat protein
MDNKKNNVSRSTINPAMGMSGATLEQEPLAGQPEQTGLYRKIDWWTFAIVTVAVLIGYLLTITPDLTLEDSGELAVGSMYAGVPHPPGYPVWTLYTWAFTKLLPFSNISWRVAVSSAVAAALSAGLVGLLVSRGSSLLLEGIAQLKGIPRKMEDPICLMSGFAAGMLIGFNGFIWSQAVIVEVYTLALLSLTGMLATLFRWVWKPEDRKYLYLSFFLFGICFCNHQTLIVAALGIEVLVVMVDRKIGRDFLLGNTLVWLLITAAHAFGIVRTFQENPGLSFIFQFIGWISVSGFAWLMLHGTKQVSTTNTLAWAISTGVHAIGMLIILMADGLGAAKFALVLHIIGLLATFTLAHNLNPERKTIPEWCRDILLLGGLVAMLLLGGRLASYPGQSGVPWLQVLLLLTLMLGSGWLIRRLFSSMHKLDAEIRWAVTGAAVVAAATLFYVLTPAAWMPWLQILVILAMGGGLAYFLKVTRNWDPGMAVVVFAGAAFVAGSLFYFYMPLASTTNPPMNWGYPRTWEGFMHTFTRGQYEKTTPTESLVRYSAQVWVYLQGLKEEFNWANLMIGCLPFAFLLEMKRRHRGWLIGLTAMYVCLAFLLMYLLNAGIDRQSRELVKVFYTSSHVIMALFVGYGLAIICGLLMTRLQETFQYFLVGIGVAIVLNLVQVIEAFSPALNMFLLPRIAALIALGLSILFLLVVFSGLSRPKHSQSFLASVLALYFFIPVDSILDHWADNEQRGHLFGFWFGHDMFEPGADAGAPAPKDADGTPLYPPMTEHAVLFGGTDPGRFCPTYMIFAESFIPAKHRRNPEFDRRDVYIITQNALADNTYLDYIRAHYHRSAQKDLPFFLTMLNDTNSMARIPRRTNFLASLATPLDRWMTGMGDRMEKRRRAGESLFAPNHFLELDSLRTAIRQGGDPLNRHLRERLGDNLSKGPKELAQGLNEILEGASIYTPDRFSEIPLSEHVQLFAIQNPDSHNRIRLNRLLLEAAYPDWITASPGGLYPDREIYCPSNLDLSRSFDEYSQDAMRRAEFGQLRPGEVLNQLPDGRVSVGGQAAVMAINALLTQVIFERNPGHEFFVEESFPLEWMHPHLVPFGIIMKIEREPVERLTEEQFQRDHNYWRQYSERLIGDWIEYDTPVEDVCDFALEVYQRRDYKAFQGDPKFVRDGNAQKAFSKLRNAIGKSVYHWRAEHATDPEYKARLFKEAEFALKQAFAYCPYSPETTYNYAALLTHIGRYRDAYLVTYTAYLLDPYNEGIRSLVEQLEQFKDVTIPVTSVLPENEEQLQSVLTNLDAAFNTAAAWLQGGRSNEAMILLERLLQSPNADAETLIALAQGYAQLQRPDKMEEALEKYTRIAPDSPEAWFDLAAIQAAQTKAASAASSLRKAYALSDERLQSNPQARNLRTQFLQDPRFGPVRSALNDL